MPGIQVYVIRILFICPIYAITSCVAIVMGQDGLYAETVRDIYEAVVLYSFLNLILEFCGGESDCVYQIENESPLRMPFPLCFLRPRPRDARLMRFCQRGVLQFIVIKPIMAVLTVIMIATGNLFHPAYVAVEFVIYNGSYGWALYCMYVFYLATHSLIKNFRPISKFVTVKVGLILFVFSLSYYSPKLNNLSLFISVSLLLQLIIFATYYQSLAVQAAPISNEDALRWNDLILCIEMVVFALALMLAFPVREFKGGIPENKLFANMIEVLSVGDVIEDMYHNFTPRYQDYSLQRSEFEAPETVRSRGKLSGNLDRVALEMASRFESEQNQNYPYLSVDI